MRQRGNELYALRQKFKGNISLLSNDPNGAANPDSRQAKFALAFLKVGALRHARIDRFTFNMNRQERRGTLRDFPVS